MPRFDWKDSVLIAFGFVVCVTVAMTIERWLGLELTREALGVLVSGSILGFPLLRRRLFGEPDLPEPRKGLVPSLLSIVGLFSTIAGMGLLAIFGPRLLEPPHSPPDFRAEYLDEASRHSIELEVVELADLEKPQGTRELAPSAEVTMRRDAENYAAERLDEWHRERAWHDGTTRWLTVLALGLVGLGALAIQLRYRSRE